jgi:hypothetical protein
VEARVPHQFPVNGLADEDDMRPCTLSRAQRMVFIRGRDYLPWDHFLLTVRQSGQNGPRRTTLVAVLADPGADFGAGRWIAARRSSHIYSSGPPQPLDPLGHKTFLLRFYWMDNVQ